MDLRHISGAVIAIAATIAAVATSMGPIQITTQTEEWILGGCTIFGLIGLGMLFWPMAKKGSPDKRGPTGIFIGPAASHNRFRKIKISGMQTAIEDHGTENAYEDVEIDKPSPMPVPEPRRRLFQGFRFPRRKK